MAMLNNQMVYNPYISIYNHQPDIKKKHLYTWYGGFLSHAGTPTQHGSFTTILWWNPHGVCTTSTSGRGSQLLHHRFKALVKWAQRRIGDIHYQKNRLLAYQDYQDYQDIKSSRYTGWWFQPLWKILVSWDYYIHVLWKIKMFQNTNQYIIVPSKYATATHCFNPFKKIRLKSPVFDNTII